VAVVCGLPGAVGKGGHVRSLACLGPGGADPTREGRRVESKYDMFPQRLPTRPEGARLRDV